jgi:hypothetical protein
MTDKRKTGRPKTDEQRTVLVQPRSVGRRIHAMRDVVAARARGETVCVVNQGDPVPLGLSGPPGPTSRKTGRPRTDDPRTYRVKMSASEWARCVEAAKASGAKSTAAWVRSRCGL